MKVTTELAPYKVTAHILAPVMIAFETDISDPYPHDLQGTLRWSFEARQYQLSVFTLKQRSADASPITGATMREIRVNDLAHAAASHGVVSHAMVIGRQWRWSRVQQEVASVVADGKPRPTSEVLELVALVYEFSQILAEKPVKNLESMFGLAPSTANHWVKLARERGHLDAAPEN